MWAVLLVTIGTFLFFLHYWNRRPPGTPPGPKGWPVLGSLHQLGRNPHLVLTDMARTYGQIFSLYMGSEFTIVLNDFEIIREAFLKRGEVFSGRPDMHVLQELQSDEYGLHGECIQRVSTLYIIIDKY